MIDLLWVALGLVIGLAVGGGVGVWWVNNGVNSLAQQKAAEARLLLEEARSQQKEILLQAKDDALRIRNYAEAEIRESRQGIQKQEERKYLLMTMISPFRLKVMSSSLPSPIIFTTAMPCI